MTAAATERLLDRLRCFGAAPICMDGDVTPAMWWAHRREGGASGLPAWMKPTVSQLDRYFRLQTQELRPISRAAVSRAERRRGQELERERLVQALGEDCEARAARRAAELELANYVERVAGVLRRQDLGDLAISLRQCRQSGCVGLKPGGGGHVVAWDHKCGQVRLCPDESREETQRLATRYVPALLEWAGADPRRRLFYAVFAGPNYEEGRLAHGKAREFRQLKARVTDAKDRYCPVRVQGGRLVRDGRKTVHARFPTIKGAVVVQEDPLAAPREDATGRTSYGWNVHLNVILCVEGPLDYRALRESWGHQLEIRELDRDKDKLRGALLELVKYSARVVPAKSAEKAERHATDAPAMTEWPPALWAEWWESQHRFRRTRSYGCMHGVGTPDSERLDMDAVEWVGTVRYDAPAGAYRVDLIPGHKCRGSHQQSGPEAPETMPTEGRPPPWTRH